MARCDAGCRNLATALVQALTAPACSHFLSIHFMDFPSDTDEWSRMLQCSNSLRDKEHPFDSLQCFVDLFIAHKYVSSMKHRSVSAWKRPLVSCNVRRPLIQFGDIGGTVIIALSPWPMRCLLWEKLIFRLSRDYPICGKSATTRTPGGGTSVPP